MKNNQQKLTLRDILNAIENGTELPDKQLDEFMDNASNSVLLKIHRANKKKFEERRKKREEQEDEERRKK